MTSESIGPADLNRWDLWTWAAVVVAVVVHGGGTIVATLWIVLGTQGVCREAATPHDLTMGRVGLAIVVALAAAPWLLAAWRSRPHRIVLVAAAVLVALYPSVALVDALTATPVEWTLDWCLF